MPNGGTEESDRQGGERQALEEILAWEPMQRSPQLSAFLTYVVEAVLRGEGATVKAYSIAVDVFGRPEDFDPQSDPIVRVQARRLRSLLEEFYRSGRARAPVRIVLPVGRYSPDFVPNDQRVVPTPPAPADVPAELPKSGSSQWTWVAGGMAILLLLASLYSWPDLGRRSAPAPGPAQPGSPLLIIGEFENLLEEEADTPLVAGLAVDLVTDLNLFPDLRARFGGARPQVEESDRGGSGAVYVVSGVVRQSQEGVLYSVLLHDANAEEILARYEFEVAGDEVETTSVQDVSTYFGLRLGNPRGPLHADTREWVISSAAEGVVLETYPCIVAYLMFREASAGVEREQVMECAAAGAEQGVPEAMAILGSLLTDAAWRTGEATPEVIEARQEGVMWSDAAVAADPLSAFVWTQRAFATFLTGQVELARNYYHAAMQLNPAFIEIPAEYAFTEAHLGNWDNANRLSAIALSVESDPPDPYYAVPAFWALRSGDYEAAVTYGRRMIDKIPHTGAAILVAAGGYLDDVNIINAYLPRLLAAPRFKRQGIMPALQFNIFDRELLRVISNGLLSAGVPLDRLVEPF